jgi:hypothetical protein
MSMDAAIQAALYGPEKKGVSIFSHGFNVKPAEFGRHGSKLTVTGQISHRLKSRPDDQLYYTIFLEQAVLKNIQSKIDRGGWTPIAAPIISGLAAYFGGVAVTPDQVASVGRALGRLYDGSWESAADLIVATIAVTVSAEESTKVPPPASDVPQDGALLKEPSHPAVYVVFGGAKFYIPSEEEFLALGFAWDAIQVVPDGALVRIPDVPREGTLLRERSYPEVYVMQGGYKSHIPSWQRFEELGFSQGDIRLVPDGALARVPSGAAV